MSKVSVIIPVYNAEKFIEKCAHSLFSQTLDDIEYIFVDDCSPDKSIEIVKGVLEKYPNRINHVKLLHNNKNRGVAFTRQKGVEAATGRYIIHCDPDDWIEPEMYEKLYTAAAINNVDIVVCDFFKHSPNKIERVYQDIPHEQIQLITSLLDHRLSAFLWNKLIKKEFWDAQALSFSSELSMWEDLAVVVPTMMATSRIYHIPLALYHYQTTISNSLSNTVSKKRIESCIRACGILESNLRKGKEIREFEPILSNFRIRACFPLLSQPKFLNPELWRRNCTLHLREIHLLKLNWKVKLLSVFAIMKADFILKLIATLRSK